MGIGRENKVLSMKCGYHTLILTQDKLYAFGRNELGELGIGDNQVKQLSYPRDITSQFGGERIKKISAGIAHSLILAEENLYATGYNSTG